MASTKRNTRDSDNQRQGKYRPVQWINVALSDDDKTWLEDNITNVDKFANWLSDVVSTGHRVSVKWDDRNNCCVGSIVIPVGDKDHILTGRGSTAFTAVFAALYRHFVILEQDWTSQSQEQAGGGLFD